MTVGELRAFIADKDDGLEVIINPQPTQYQFGLREVPKEEPKADEVKIEESK